jgi:putative ABC transport system permease protein
VDWGQFTINFFLVVEPGVLDGAPAFRIAAARVPASSELALQNRIAATSPNVTVLRLRAVLEKVVSVLEQVGFGVRLLGGFTVLAGIAILGGAISAQAVRRGREVALYKTIGMTRVQVVVVFAVEYGLVGLIAATIGSVGGVALAFGVTRFGMEIDWAWAPGAILLAMILTVFLSIIAGLVASMRALAVRPLAVLRQGE